MAKIMLKEWKILFDDHIIDCDVPGDITIDLYNAGIIDNPYFAENHKKIKWIPGRDFDYECVFIPSDDILSSENATLIFNGIDLFSDIYLNGKLLGSTENMFRAYKFDITRLIVRGENKLVVHMRSTLNEMDKFDTRGYYGVFNVKRLFVRKAQCHFGWDWAPDICGYGIWQDVFIEYGSKYKIEDNCIVADADGNLTFFTELNYNIRPMLAPDGVNVAINPTERNNDTLEYFISEKPFGDEFIEKTIQVDGKKQFCALIFKNPELWYPVGYGSQPLYNYKVRLMRGGKVCDEITGSLAFRTVELKERPKEGNQLGHELFVNGERIYVKGSNWVPIECFTGVVKDEKYKRLVSLAKNANVNMLRVWGGGIYEKDIFYNLCDELGIMVWQDVMLSCGDIPEEDPHWVKNMLSEVDYQVRRLRNHPSLVYWCGGNEKTGCYALQISKGDFFVNYTLQGYIRYLDDTRPYRRQSPYGHTDVANDTTSGESHYNSFERSLWGDVHKYREYVAEKVVPFISECAILGPCSVESLKKFFSPDKLWPMNEEWRDRLMDNPYGCARMDFAHRELYFSENLYGKISGLEEFVMKGMTAHAETLATEIEFSRFHNGVTSGFLNWMFSDIWPQATWAIVDYYCEPKAAYYRMKRAFSPLLVTFVYDGTDTNLAVIADGNVVFNGEIGYGIKTYDGKTLYNNTVAIDGLHNATAAFKVSSDCKRSGIYLYAEYIADGERRKSLYSPQLWSDGQFGSDYSFRIDKISENKAKITVCAKSFVKSLTVSFSDNCNITYSDNYVDMENGDEITIEAESDFPIDFSTLKVTDFHKETA